MLQTTFPGIQRTSSGLGFGCMRLPVVGGRIDEAEAIRMIRYAIDHGVRYIDTAYPYHGGESEIVVGKALKDGYRDKVILTTKLPIWKLQTAEDMPKTLDEQLKKLDVDHVDFYLMHAMNEERFTTIRSMDYQSFLEKAMAQGKIRYPGFSFHDNADTFLRILNDYDWKLAQVQMNILDDNAQATLNGIHAAGKKGTGVVIMEPLRGGLLATPPADVQALYDAFPVKRSAVEWAFRFLYTMPEVVTILSGMSTMEQVQDNLRIFDAAVQEPLTDAEQALYAQVKETYMSRTKTRCTGCRYCQPCPRGVKIPQIFQGYDGKKLREKDDFAAEYAKIVEEQGDASRCVKCRKCEAACPQHLPITRYLAEIRAECTS